MSLSTHVLDLTAGSPAAGMPVRLERLDDAGWVAVATGHTDADGRWRVDEASGPGSFRWVFAPGEGHFFPEIAIIFTAASDAHLHVPLLLSPFGYSTYRGS
ncbi:MAG: hydroxyisourate hydrolase [Hamadaea sp.]|nr:hydroxyisourate hydrolase [Hamadaea sp.]